MGVLLHLQQEMKLLDFGTYSELLKNQNLRQSLQLEHLLAVIITSGEEWNKEDSSLLLQNLDKMTKKTPLNLQMLADDEDAFLNIKICMFCLVKKAVEEMLVCKFIA